LPGATGGSAEASGSFALVVAVPGYADVSAAEGLAVLTSAICAGDANTALPSTVPTRRITRRG
jgi:hypothetical protein